MKSIDSHYIINDRSHQHQNHNYLGILTAVYKMFNIYFSSHFPQIKSIWYSNSAKKNRYNHSLDIIFNYYIFNYNHLLIVECLFYSKNMKQWIELSKVSIFMLKCKEWHFHSILNVTNAICNILHFIFKLPHTRQNFSYFTLGWKNSYMLILIDNICNVKCKYVIYNEVH